jgi:hypothetical protein
MSTSFDLMVSEWPEGKHTMRIRPSLKDWPAVLNLDYEKDTAFDARTRIRIFVGDMTAGEVRDFASSMESTATALFAYANRRDGGKGVDDDEN